MQFFIVTFDFIEWLFTICFIQYWKVLRMLAKIIWKGFFKGKWEYLKIDQIMLIFFKVGLEVRGNKIISMPNIEEVNIGGMYMLCKE